MRLLLDTAVLIDALRGRSAAQRLRSLRDTAQVPWICAINIEEVMRGVNDEENAATVRLLSGLRLAPLGRSEGIRAGRWRADFARKGITLAQADCLIAAAAVGIGARLATGNLEHFPMPGLETEHWPVGA